MNRRSRPPGPGCRALPAPQNTTVRSAEEPRPDSGHELPRGHIRRFQVMHVHRAQQVGDVDRALRRTIAEDAHLQRVGVGNRAGRLRRDRIYSSPRELGRVSEMRFERTEDIDCAVLCAVAGGGQEHHSTVRGVVPPDAKAARIARTEAALRTRVVMRRRRKLDDWPYMAQPITAKDLCCWARRSHF